MLNQKTNVQDLLNRLAKQKATTTKVYDQDSVFIKSFEPTGPNDWLPQSTLLSLVCRSHQFDHYRLPGKQQGHLHDLILTERPLYGMLQDIGNHREIITFLQSLGYHVYMVLNMFKPGSSGGNITFSKVKANGASIIIDPYCFPKDRTTGEPMGYTDLSYTTLKLSFGNLDIFNVYLSAFDTPSNREKSLSCICEYISPRKKTIVAGNFNCHGLDTTPNQYIPELLPYVNEVGKLYLFEVANLIQKKGFNKTPISKPNITALQRMQTTLKKYGLTKIGEGRSSTTPLSSRISILKKDGWNAFDLEYGVETDCVFTNSSEQIPDPLKLQQHPALILNS